MPGLRALKILPIMPDQQCRRAKGKEREKVTIWFITLRWQVSHLFTYSSLNCFFVLNGDHECNSLKIMTACGGPKTGKMFGYCGFLQVKGRVKQPHRNRRIRSRKRPQSPNCAHWMCSLVAVVSLRVSIKQVGPPFEPGSGTILWCRVFQLKFPSQWSTL